MAAALQDWSHCRAAVGLDPLAAGGSEGPTALLVVWWFCPTGLAVADEGCCTVSERGGRVSWPCVTPVLRFVWLTRFREKGSLCTASSK